MSSGNNPSIRGARGIAFSQSDGVTLMTVTPFPSKVIELDIDDPRSAALARTQS
jgi:hypothetical protein